ncbi:UNVERIFIED_CONTAM: hypothetical protein HDU68_005357 [Siphonaria sp. JEL0065]|nr:hypothetical protein HDU68_005357 [Siphonaria sp. JEL0065]
MDLCAGTSYTTCVASSPLLSRQSSPNTLNHTTNSDILPPNITNDYLDVHEDEWSDDNEINATFFELLESNDLDLDTKHDSMMDTFNSGQDSCGDVAMDPSNDDSQVVCLTSTHASQLQAAFASIADTFESILSTWPTPTRPPKSCNTSKSLDAFPNSKPTSTLSFGPVSGIAFTRFFKSFAKQCSQEEDPDRVKERAIQEWKQLSSKEKKFYKKSADKTLPPTPPPSVLATPLKRVRGLSGRDYFIREKISENVFDRLDITNQWNTLTKSQKQASNPP